MRRQFLPKVQCLGQLHQVCLRDRFLDYWLISRHGILIAEHFAQFSLHLSWVTFFFSDTYTIYLIASVVPEEKSPLAALGFLSSLFILTRPGVNYRLCSNAPICFSTFCLLVLYNVACSLIIIPALAINL